MNKNNANSTNILNDQNLSSDNNNLSFDNKISEKKNDKEEKIECEICNEIFIINNDNKLEKCGHAFCSSCWFDSLSVKIKENYLQ